MDPKPSNNARGPAQADEHEIPTEMPRHELHVQATAKSESGTEQQSSSRTFVDVVRTLVVTAEPDGPTFTDGSSVWQPVKSDCKRTNRLIQCHVCIKTVLCRTFGLCTVCGVQFWICEKCLAHGGKYELSFPENRDSTLPVIRAIARPTDDPVSDSGHVMPDNATLADSGGGVSSSGEANDSGQHDNYSPCVNRWSNLSWFKPLDGPMCAADDAETGLGVIQSNIEEAKDTEAHPGGKVLTDDKMSIQYQRRLAAIQRTDSAIDMAYTSHDTRSPATLNGIGGPFLETEDKANSSANLEVSTAMKSQSSMAAIDEPPLEDCRLKRSGLHSLRPDEAGMDTEPSGHQSLPEGSTPVRKSISRKSLRLVKRMATDFRKVHGPDTEDTVTTNSPRIAFVETIKKKLNVYQSFLHRPKDERLSRQSSVGKPDVLVETRCTHPQSLPTQRGEENGTYSDPITHAVTTAERKPANFGALPVRRVVRLLKRPALPVFHV